MKTQGRGNTGGRIPPPHDDYDDYEEVEYSPEDDLEVAGLEDDYEDEQIDTPASSRRAGARSGSNGNNKNKPGNGRSTPPQRGGTPRVRPPLAVGRTAAPLLPKRRQRPEIEVEPSAAETAPTGRPATGNGKRKESNGATSTAALTAPAASTPTPRSGSRASQSAIATETPAPPQPETLSTRVFRLIVNYETLIYMGIFALAFITRFWDIGDRGIHHDESLHAVFSRNLYTGAGYTHDPMMHGPVQFNLIAGMYWLFGTSDATARFASALCGIWVVMSPFFLRRQMGRWPALIASFLLLIAPGILYFSRMAREDSVFSAMEMIMIVGLWRFISTRRPADFFIFCAGLSLMFTIKESAYLTVAVLGSMFALLFAYQAGWAIVGAFAAYGAAMGGMLLVISGKMKSGEIAGLPNIPAQNPDYGTITNFASNFLGHPLVQWSAIITVLFIVGLVFLLWSKRRQVVMADAEAAYEMDGEYSRPVRPSRTTRPSGRPAQSPLPTRRPRQSSPGTDEVIEAAPPPASNGHENGAAVLPAEESASVAPPAYAYEESYEATEVWDPRRLDPKPGTLLAHYQPGSVPHLIGSLFGRPSVLLIGFLIAATIFIVLYSVFFTDLPRGIASGLFASLGYWMAQQGVARGGQPWYYYFLIIPLYQPIAVFFSVVATIFFSVKGIRGFLKNREDRLYGETDQPRLGLYNTDRPVPFAKFSAFLPLFSIWWLGGAWFIYSWAGEKMPWLIMHMIRPAILLASLFLGALVASIIARRQERIAWARAYYREYYGDEPDAPTIPLTESGRRASDGGRGAPQSKTQVARNPKYRRAPVVLREQEPPWISWNRPGSKFPALSFLTILTLLALAWGLKLNALSYVSDYTGWGISWVYPMLVVILVVSYSVWIGPSRVLRYLALGIFSIFFLYEFRSAIDLTYQHPDVPIEMAVYVQTSPDVTRTVKEIDDYSTYATGGLNTRVTYDSFASWPFEWYFRDFKNKNFIAANEVPTGPDYPILVLEYAKHNNDPALADYLVQRYAMRWWFPEDWYKSQLIQGQDYQTAPFGSQLGAILGTTAGTFTNPQMTSTLWKYLIFRQTPEPLGSEDMVVAVRRDIAQIYHYLQYQPPDRSDEPPPTVRTPPAPDGSFYR